MPEPASARSKQMIAIGCLALAGGGYFILVGMALLPIPGGAPNLHGPLWIVFCAGLAFFLAGAAVLLQAAGRANEQGELPAGTPMWTRVAQYLIGVALFVSFGMIASWIAFAPGERSFSSPFTLFGAGFNAGAGRIAFGIGAVIVWLCTIAFAVSGARRLFGRKSDAP